MGNDGRVAVVTGGARGIGGGISEGLGADGYTVVVADLSLADAKETAAAIEAAGGTAHPVEMDVTDTAAVTGALDTVAREIGDVDVLVNNAGWDDHMRFVETDEAFWDKVLEINYKSTLRTVRHVLPGMSERGRGRIVNIGSDAGRVGSSMEAVYSGAKGAVIAFTKTVAREAARYGVTANVVCPGPTRTPAMEAVLAAQGDADAVMTSMVKAVPMRRLGEPADIAAAVRFFASEAAGFVTGQTLSVSGGLTMA
jgi:2-hydroxycyclohexanecarboxyl-CoA dehydrogenase